MLTGTALPEESLHNVGAVKVVEGIRGGPGSGFVQQVDQGQVVGGEADALGVELRVLDAESVLYLDLGPGLVDDGPAPGVDDGHMARVSGHGDAGLLARVDQPH